MISLEKARALKEAGLVWEPKQGDWYYCLEFDQPELQAIDAAYAFGFEPDDDDVFAPRLDQELGEIQSRFKINQWWEMADDWFSIYELRNIDGAEGSVLIKSIHDSDTPEDAAADALLWLIGQQ